MTIMMSNTKKFVRTVFLVLLVMACLAFLFNWGYRYARSKFENKSVHQ